MDIEGDESRGSEEIPHRVAAGGIQHGRWSAEQAEELGASPLLGRQVPAWVDHLQGQQRRGHSL